MRWWRRKRRRPGQHVERLVDGDTVVPPGQRRLADILAAQQQRARWVDLTRPADPRAASAVDQAARNALCGPTTQLPQAPLLTPGAQWRATGGAR